MQQAVHTDTYVLPFLSTRDRDIHAQGHTYTHALTHHPRLPRRPPVGLPALDRHALQVPKCLHEHLYDA